MFAQIKRPIFWVPIALLVAAIAVVTIFWLNQTCLLPGRRLAMKQAGAVGCFEFWLNRYQAAWGSILAAGTVILTALVTWRDVRTQLRHQAEANYLSKLTFWQRRYDEDYAASASAEHGLEICNAIREEIGRPHSGQFPHVEEAIRLSQRGHFPVALLNPRGIERVAVKFNRLAEIINRHQRADGGVDAMNARDDALGEHLQAIAELDTCFAKIAREIDEEALKAGTIVARLYDKWDRQGS